MEGVLWNAVEGAAGGVLRYFAGGENWVGHFISPFEKCAGHVLSCLGVESTCPLWGR